MDSKYPADVLDEDTQEQEASVYPDIDENTHNSWQNEESFDIGSMLASVLDPRLFGDQPAQQPQSINQYPARVEAEGTPDADYPSSNEYEGPENPPVLYPPVPGEKAQSDEDFMFSEEDESDRYVYCRTMSKSS